MKKRRYAAQCGGTVPGFQEMGLLVVIVLILFFLPRFRTKAQAPPPRRLGSLSGRMRLALVVSMAWPLGVAYVMKPWQGELFNFFGIGLAPVALGWALAWVVAGYRGRAR
jgi:hypothetical protein